jgi:hypothetical protein
MRGSYRAEQSDKSDFSNSPENIYSLCTARFGSTKIGGAILICFLGITVLSATIYFS